MCGGGIALKGVAELPVHHGRERGLRGRTAGKKGDTCGFPLLVNHPLSLQDALRA